MLAGVEPWQASGFANFLELAGLLEVFAVRFTFSEKMPSFSDALAVAASELERSCETFWSSV